MDLFVGNIRVASTYAAEPIERPTPSPVREFRLRVRDVWGFCDDTSRLSVRHKGRKLLIAGHGWNRRPALTGTRPMSELSAKIAGGYVFTQFGRLQLSKEFDDAWRNDVIALYRKLADAMRQVSQTELCVCYGTHLGAVRAGNFIGHDHDFDACFISKGTTGAETKAEALAMVRALRPLGFRAQLKPSCAYYYHDDYPDVFIDVFHLYFNAAGNLQWAFGVANKTPFTKSDFQGYTTIQLAGQDVTAVSNPEIFAERIYGEGWQTPNPGFSWRRARVARARDARFTTEEIADHYRSADGMEAA